MKESSGKRDTAADSVRVASEIAFLADLLALHAAIEAASGGDGDARLARLTGELRVLARRQTPADQRSL